MLRPSKRFPDASERLDATEGVLGRWLCCLCRRRLLTVIPATMSITVISLLLLLLPPLPLPLSLPTPAPPLLLLFHLIPSNFFASPSGSVFPADPGAANSCLRSKVSALCMNSRFHVNHGCPFLSLLVRGPLPYLRSAPSAALPRFCPVLNKHGPLMKYSTTQHRGFTVSKKGTLHFELFS